MTVPVPRRRGRLTRHRYALLCYGARFTGAETLKDARRLAESHIHSCPRGAMPWARPVKWVEGLAGERPEDSGPRFWAAAASGEWLNHLIEEEGENGEA